jgi:hypothetical protein
MRRLPEDTPDRDATHTGIQRSARQPPVTANTKRQNATDAGRRLVIV